MGKAKGQVSPKVKLQVVRGTLARDKTLGQIAKAYGVHPISVGLWKNPVVVGYEWTGRLLSNDGVRYPIRSAAPGKTLRWKPSSAGSKQKIDQCCSSARPSTNRQPW